MFTLILHFDFVSNKSSIIVLLWTVLDENWSPIAKWFIGVGWKVQSTPGIADGIICKCNTPLKLWGCSLSGITIRLSYFTNKNALCSNSAVEPDNASVNSKNPSWLGLNGLVTSIIQTLSPVLAWSVLPKLRMMFSLYGWIYLENPPKLKLPKNNGK